MKFPKRRNWNPGPECQHNSAGIKKLLVVLSIKLYESN